MFWGKRKEGQRGEELVECLQGGGCEEGEEGVESVFGLSSSLIVRSCLHTWISSKAISLTLK